MVTIGRKPRGNLADACHYTVFDVAHLLMSDGPELVVARKASPSLAAMLAYDFERFKEADLMARSPDQNLPTS